jgi:pimeloyl-ACP methyl ester carboxylesterase
MADDASAETVRLRDGRILGYTEYGRPDGTPLLNCHGGLACRLDIAAASETANALGIRLISPDRPGVDLSDRRPGRRMLDWPTDVEELMDQLGVGAFATIGWSMGGQYALAVAHRLPTRVARAIVVAGCAPLDEPAHFAELTDLDQRLTRLSRRSPSVARAVFGAMRTLARHAPKRFLASSSRQMGPADASVIERPETRYAAMIAHGLRHTRGAVDEYVAWAEPWGFELAAVTTPVDVWWGDADRLVARQLIEPLAHQLPHAEFTVVPGAGHFVAFDRWEDVLAPVAA